MTTILEEIESGEFAKQWAKDEEAGFPRYNALLAETRKHPINEAEREIAKHVDLASTLVE